MYHPTSRVLTLLELLQSQAQIGGPELAERLEVDRRTIRRYIEQLQELGIPVEGERGRYGAYRLRPGYKLPPLMFSNDEAIVLMLGLLLAKQAGVDSAERMVEGSLAKLLRVMPPDLRERAEALQMALMISGSTPQVGAVDQRVIAQLSLAIHRGQQVQLRYKTPARDPIASPRLTERVLDPYGLVLHSRRWYAVGYCHLRQDLRSFRLDRVQSCQLLSSTFTQPQNFNALRFLEQSLAQVTGQYEVEVLIQGSLEEIRQRLPYTLGDLQETEEAGIRLRGSVHCLRWFTCVMLEMGFPWQVVHPQELWREVEQLHHRLGQMLACSRVSSVEGY
ncbi:YafY family transcriptional regulator [Synechococcus sp. Nb3U1]|uniref:helix-turn-helix transcriptional regulator n=1 Tax=Synechococcus sp. Nb3U1 TaxID=1914529 RepID=UPI001F3F21A0|nr:YafY family protein [Synechococcus sp. Nb3U1]MCF2972061.1 YafY family transcriptional regulator [Synechococcus sp. Nb3U1]